MPTLKPLVELKIIPKANNLGYTLPLSSPRLDTLHSVCARVSHMLRVVEFLNDL